LSDPSHPTGPGTSSLVDHTQPEALTHMHWLSPATVALATLSLVAISYGWDDPYRMHEPPPVVGRWDLTVRGPDGEFPSWLEIRQSGFRTLVGSYVGQFGSARPISHIEHADGRIKFSVPPQWEHRTDHVNVEATLEGDALRGAYTDEHGNRVRWTAKRAPSLKRTAPPQWGGEIELFNGRDLSGWKPRSSATKNGWQARDGILVNAEPGNDLMTERRFTDFKLHAEFRYPSGSNSGIYLRGRYEVQIEDNFGQEATDHKIGGVYGFLTPSVNAARAANEWQSADITLTGRTITVSLNGERIIDRQIIPGITGGALDSNEGEPGPILLQGDHGRVEFRNLKLTPIVGDL
jgi:hypothetical protein